MAAFILSSAAGSQGGHSTPSKARRRSPTPMQPLTRKVAVGMVRRTEHRVAETNEPRPGGIAVSKHSKKQAQAEKLISFLVSEQGQKMFAETNREYPARTGVPAHSDIPPLDSYKTANVPMVDLFKYRSETIELFEKLGMP